MNHGRKAKSTLSRKITQYRPRGGSGNQEAENTPLEPKKARTTVKRSMTTAAKEVEAQDAKRRKILHDLQQARAATEDADGGDPAADGEWEDEPFNFDFGEALNAIAPDVEQPGPPLDASGGIFIPSGILPKPRIDTRTRSDQIKSQTAAWQAALPQLVDAYLAWKHGARAPTQAPAEPDAQPPAGDPPPAAAAGEWFTVFAIRDSDYVRHMRIEQAAGELPVVSLMRAGLMACSPSVPIVAISLGLLDLYYRVRSHAPRLGILPFVRALCDRYMCRYRPYLREQFTCAFDAYLAVQREVQRRVDCALGQDLPHWRALNSCAPCNYKLEDEQELVIEGMTAVDGGQAQKRRAGAGVADQRVFDSDYRIPPEEVDLYANQVTRRVVPKKKAKKQVEEPAPPAYVTLEESGEPGDDAPTPSVCADRWKNAKEEHFKTAPGAYEQTGVFVCLCRHGLVLWFLEMIRSGELAKYPLAIIGRMLRAGIRCRRCAYDIGCAFQGTLERSTLLGERAREACIDCGVNAFHGYGHNRLCQLRQHPLFEKGFGLEDMETCERFFSWLNGVGGVVRHVSHFHWVQYVDLAIRQWDQDKYAEISTFLVNNVRQATALVVELAPLLDAFKQQANVSDEDIESWRGLELAYLEGLQAEPAEVGVRARYVTLLAELEQARTTLAAKQPNYVDGVQPPSAEEIAAKRLSPAAVQRLFKARIDAHDRYMKTLDAVAAHENILRIDERWTSESREYQDALKEIAERDWRKALDKLELLMVQRMFELAKSHTFGTGYKMREAIGKGLKARSQAIRNAVTRYNELAQALVPPAPCVDFATLMEWTELQEFEMLRHSRAGDIRDKAWAQPANRVMAVQHYKLMRAREELVRCQVEMRRLVTAMRDEEARYDLALQRLRESDNPLAPELDEYIRRRKAVNDVHRARLAKLSLYSGFATALTPGRRIGAEDASAVPADGGSSSAGIGADAELVQDVLEDMEEADPVLEDDLNVLHDFLAQVEAVE